MASIVIRANESSNVSLSASETASSRYLAMHSGTQAYYVPVVTSGGSVTIGSKVYSYSSTKPSFAVFDGSQTLYLANNTETTTYDIPAGTYSPSTFEKMEVEQ